MSDTSKLARVRVEIIMGDVFVESALAGCIRDPG